MTTGEKQLGFHVETKAIHCGYEASAELTDVVSPIHLATTFLRTKDDQVGDYTRSRNPNRTTLEQKLKMFEGGDEAFCFGSGMAAINAIFEAVLRPGDHVIYPDDCYHGARALLTTIFAEKQITSTAVDMEEVGNVKNAIQKNTKLIWTETPSNPKLKVTDLKAVADVAKEHRILTACDSTFATPLVQRPLEFGINFVMHSSTKFFGGHSDVLGGVVVTKESSPYSQKIRMYQNIAGAVPSPFDCWLLSRSLSTFPLRVSAQNKNAMAIAEYLSKHPAIEKVFYPGLKDHKNHAVAKSQMKDGFGSVLSILVKGGKDAALKLAGSLQIFRHATSLGGVESLIEHRRSAEGDHPVSPDNLLRVSVGIEHVQDLIDDLRAGLQQIG